MGFTCARLRCQSEESLADLFKSGPCLRKTANYTLPQQFTSPSIGILKASHGQVKASGCTMTAPFRPKMLKNS